MKKNLSYLKSDFIHSLLIPRDKESHKGNFGHVLIIAGSKDMPGAAVLCSLGALRSGAGLVSVATTEKQHHIISCKIRPEVMTLSLSETIDGKISRKSLDLILSYIEKRRISSIVFGPGLGVSEDIKKILILLLKYINIPIVIDADGLNVISLNKKKFFIKEFVESSAKIIITPHPGEFSKLLGIPIDKIQKDRINVATEFAKKNNLVCVLKGHNTVITDGSNVFINTTGNPGMATGGSGDVLAGMIGAFIPQVRDKSTLFAACCGVYLHGFAGDIAVKDKTQIGLLAGDIAESIPDAIKMLERGKRL